MKHVATEMALHVLAYNFKRVMAISVPERGARHKTGLNEPLASKTSPETAIRQQIVITRPIRQTSQVNQATGLFSHSLRTNPLSRQVC